MVAFSQVYHAIFMDQVGLERSTTAGNQAGYIVLVSQVHKLAISSFA